MDYSTPGLPVHCQHPEPTQTHIHWASDAIQPSHPLFSPSPPAFNLSQHQGLFKNESVLCIRWPKHWSFSFSISPSNDYSGLTTVKIDWLDILAVQGTLKSLLQHHTSKALILQHSAFFIVQLYLTTSLTGEENGNPLQCSCLENPRDGGAWWAAVSGVAQSQTWLKWLSSSSSSSSLYEGYPGS